MEKIVGGLYDCLDDITAIDGALRAFAREIGSTIASFVVLDRLRGLTVALRAVNAPETDYSRYPELASTDLWMAAAAKTGKPMVLWGTQLADQRQVERSRYYRDLLEPNGLRFVVGCGVVNASTAAFITGHRSAGQRDFCPSTAKRVGQLLPHVLRVSRSLIDRLHSTALLDVGTVPMLRIGRHGLEFANAKGMEWLDRSAAVTWSGNRLRLKNHDADVRLNLYVSDVLANAGSCAPPPPLQLRAGTVQSPSRLLALPTFSVGSALEREPAVLIVVLDGGWRASDSFRQMFGLSNPETQLANALMGGQTVADHARARCRSIHTIRSQLKSLLQKVGVHSQTQLVRKLLLLGGGDA